ncbi:MAG TPA: magnesium transporter, partial [Erythrobacter sp.]|nr:magnesium transporter [Erythrobacter sp.]
MSESDRPLDDDGFLLARESADEARPDDRIDDERMDEENTLKKEYVEAVEQALEDGDTKAVYELVEPLHPA